MHQTAFMYMTVVGVVAILFNEAFLSLWVGHNFFGGVVLTVSIVALVFIRQLVNMDAIPLDAVLKLWPKLIVMSVFGILSLSLGYFLSKLIGPAGYPFGLTCGYLGILICYQFLLRKYDNIPVAPHLRALCRASLVSLALFACALMLARNAIFNNLNWLSLTLQAGIVGTTTALVYLFAGMSIIVRTSMWTRREGFRP